MLMTAIMTRMPINTMGMLAVVRPGMVFSRLLGSP